MRQSAKKSRRILYAAFRTLEFHVICEIRFWRAVSRLSSEKRKERERSVGREILPTNGFAQSLASPSSFSAQIAIRQETSNSECCERIAMRILYLCASRLTISSSFHRERQIKSVELCRDVDESICLQFRVSRLFRVKILTAVETCVIRRLVCD